MKISLSEVKLLRIANAKKISELEGATGNIIRETNLDIAKDTAFQKAKDNMISKSVYDKNKNIRILKGIRTLITRSQLGLKEIADIGEMKIDKIASSTKEIEKKIGQDRYNFILSLINLYHPIVEDNVLNNKIDYYKTKESIEVEITPEDVYLENGHLDYQKIEEAKTHFETNGIIYHMTADRLSQKARYKIFENDFSQTVADIDKLLGIEEQKKQETKKEKETHKQKIKKNGFINAWNIIYLILTAFALTITIIFLSK